MLQFIFAHVLTQLALLYFYLFEEPFRRFIEALHGLYVYSPTLFYYYLGGTVLLVWLIVGWFRRYILLRDVGLAAERAAYTRGHRDDAA